MEFWARRGLPAWLLLPLAGVFAAVVAMRRLAYRRGWLSRQRLPVPVIVVGNISVGGTGKTPLLTMLAPALRARGYRPGIVARGYGGRSSHWPRAVLADSDPHEVGDEPVLLATLTGCPLSVGPDRVAAARALLAEHDCDLILSDDGLQHYRLARDVEIIVIDARRRLGNRWPLPAGPLREPPSRLQQADFIVINGGEAADAWSMRLSGTRCIGLGSAEDCELDALRGRTVHAVAGIGDPERFFSALEAAGLTIERHAFPDHHAYTPADVDFGAAASVLMTGKDAVKCRHFRLPGAVRWLAVEAELQAGFVEALCARLPAPAMRDRFPNEESTWT